MQKQELAHLEDLTRLEPDEVDQSEIPNMHAVTPTRLREALNRQGDTEGENKIRTIADLVGHARDPGLCVSRVNCFSVVVLFVITV